MKTSTPISDKVDLTDLYDKLGLQTIAAREFLRMSLEDVVLFDRKQHDYGSGNISQWGLFGVVVRMSDKFERVRNLFNNRRKARVSESIRDNLQDIGVYSRIARMIDDGKWPNE